MRSRLCQPPPFTTGFNYNPPVTPPFALSLAFPPPHIPPWFGRVQTRVLNPPPPSPLSKGGLNPVVGQKKIKGQKKCKRDKVNDGTKSKKELGTKNDICVLLCVVCVGLPPDSPPPPSAIVWSLGWVWGFTRQPENSKRTLEGPHASNTTKIPEENPQRKRKKNEFWGGGERRKKKREILGPHCSGPHPSGPHPSGRHPSEASRQCSAEKPAEGPKVGLGCLGVKNGFIKIRMKVAISSKTLSSKTKPKDLNPANPNLETQTLHPEP